MGAEENLNKILYKVFLFTLKRLPFALALCAALNTTLSFFAIDLAVLSFIGGTSFLAFIFIYIAALLFRFCVYHRVFLDYVAVNNIIDIIDLYYGIPVGDITLFSIQMVVFFLAITIALIFHIKSTKHVKTSINK